MEHHSFSMHYDTTGLIDRNSHPFLPAQTAFSKNYFYERSKENGSIIE